MISMLFVSLLRTVGFVDVAFGQTTTGKNQTPTGGNTAPTTFELPNPLDTTSITDLLSRILQGLTVIAIPIVAIIVVVAGFRLITSGGNPETRTKAKDMILWAAIGFGALLLADSVALIVKDFLIH